MAATSQCLSRCCGARCELFVKYTPCLRSDSESCVDDDTPIFVCKDTLCIGGGRVDVLPSPTLRINGRCYQLIPANFGYFYPPNTIDPPSDARPMPENALTYAAPTVECVPGPNPCLSPLCDSTRRYIKATPCRSDYNHEGVWVCKNAVTRCCVGRVTVDLNGIPHSECFRTSPNDSQEVDEDDVPPGDIKLAVQPCLYLPEAVGPVTTCCECACNNVPLLNTEYRACPTGPEPDPYTEFCCCGPTARGRVAGFNTHVSFSRIRLDGSFFNTYAQYTFISSDFTTQQTVPWRYRLTTGGTNQNTETQVIDTSSTWSCGSHPFPPIIPPLILPGQTCGTLVEPLPGGSRTQTASRDIKISCRQIRWSQTYKEVTVEQDGTRETNTHTLTWTFEIEPNAIGDCALECSDTGLAVVDRSINLSPRRQTPDRAFAAPETFA